MKETWEVDLEVRHHLSSLLAQVGIAAFQALQLGLRHLQLAPEGVHFHMGCCQLLPCAPLYPQGTSNRPPSTDTSVIDTKTHSYQMAGFGKVFKRQLSEGIKWHRPRCRQKGVCHQKVQLHALFPLKLQRHQLAMPLLLKDTKLPVDKYSSNAGCIA